MWAAAGPRGRAELLMRPGYCCSSSETPCRRSGTGGRETTSRRRSGRETITTSPITCRQLREWLERLLSCDLQSRLRNDLPELTGPEATATGCSWRRSLQNLLSGGRLSRGLTAASRWPDSWRLLQYALPAGPAEVEAVRRHTALTSHLGNTAADAATPPAQSQQATAPLVK